MLGSLPTPPGSLLLCPFALSCSPEQGPPIPTHTGSLARPPCQPPQPSLPALSRAQLISSCLLPWQLLPAGPVGTLRVGGVRDRLS